jgi:hypothetical protein
VRPAVFAALLLPLLWFGTGAGIAQPTAAPAANTARIWFYRVYEPYVSRNYATVRLNGALAGSVDPYAGYIYRDVPPGYYHLTVDSTGQDVNQDTAVELGPGQEAYIKILNAPNWDTSGTLSAFSRDTYYLWVMPPQLARQEMASRPF